MEKIQEILNNGLDRYEKEHKIVMHKKKVINAIKNCKTANIGAHKYICDECRYEEIAYNSCRNRHCPNCQTGKKLKWIEARKEEVLNIKYYHIVFTIPSELYTIAIQNQEKIYKILFRSSSEKLQELERDEKYLGAEIGFFSILHTWGQNLMYHPHVHLVVTGGGLTEVNTWKEKEEDFFIPVQVRSRVFRGKFLDYMKKEKIEFYGSNKDLENAECVIQYLGRYTHRVAISNERILKIEGEKVTFKWRDYKDNDKMKEMIISIQEFK